MSTKETLNSLKALFGVPAKSFSIFFKYGPFPASFWGAFYFFHSLIHWYNTIDIFTMFK